MPKINETITTPNQSSRNGKIPLLIAYHIAEGTYEGTKAWFKNPESGTSGHYIVGKDGKICQVIPLDKMAWCTGTLYEDKDKNNSRYYKHSTLDVVKQNGGNANWYTVSIEFEGMYSQTKGALTDAQLEAAIWLAQYIQSEVKRIYNYDIPTDRQHLVGHYEITPITRPNCPGQLFPWDALMAALKPQEAMQTEVWHRVQLDAFRLRANAEAQQQEAIAKGFTRAIIKTEK